MRINEVITEAPLADYQPIGNFEKPGPFRATDRKLVTHPVNQLKAAQFFEKTPYDFRLFFSNIPGTGKYAEYGKMDPHQLRDIFGENTDTILNGHENAITVVFVGNSGTGKVMITPWIMAHRIGHAIQASVRRGGNGGTWRAAEDHFFEAINRMLADYYGKRSVNQFGNKVNTALTAEYNALFNTIGTQRSSRQNKIDRPYEFLYELFAQYLGTGNVTLNPLPQRKDYGRKAWGTSTKAMRLNPEHAEETKYSTEILARDMEFMFDDVLSSLVGDILVM
jgi:hypothetical protein